MLRLAPLRRLVSATLLAAPLLAAGPAAARLDRTELGRVAAAPAAGAQVPRDLVFADAVAGRRLTLGEVLGGRPSLLLPVDYTCGNVCDPMLAMSGAALAATGLAAGREYGLVLVGIDPRDDAAAARRMLDAEAAIPGAAALVGDEAAITRLTDAVGYRFAYDPGTDGFAHPAAAMVLTGDGRVARVLSPLALNGRDLRLAMVEAGEGRTGGLSDRIALLCYGYDAATGVYTPLIRRILSVAGAATILALGLGILLLNRRARAA